MSMLSGFNAEEHRDMGQFDPIPEGEYVAMIVDSEEKENSKGTGKYLRLDFIIVEGDHEGRTVSAFLNLQHENADTVRIAQEELATLCRAIGNLHPNDSSELHSLPVIIKLKVTPAKGAYGPGNRIKGYKSARAATTQARASKEAEAKNPVTPSTPPWQRG